MPYLRARIAALTLTTIALATATAAPASASAAHVTRDVCVNLPGRQLAPPQGRISLTDGRCIKAELGTPPKAPAKHHRERARSLR